MDRASLIWIFFFYGLAFFSMGLVIAVEYGRAGDLRLRHALRPLAVFGLIHGGHEWLEMFMLLEFLPGQQSAAVLWSALRIGLLAFSFLSLAAFGSSLLAADERLRRMSLTVPLVMAAIWGFGLLVMGDRFPSGEPLIAVMDVWTRYVLAVPGSILATAGLIAQQRAFRRAGLVEFSRDSLWAAVAIAWYGIIGQTFVQKSLLPPSTVLNQELFLAYFGIPIQLLRAAAAVLTAIFVIRFLRAFEVEDRRRIAALQSARLQEAEERETLRGELLRRVVSAQEAERQRIARELHDETGQALTALGLGLRGISTSLSQDPAKASDNLHRLEGLVTHSLNELQRLISDLRPSHLDDLGLAAALRWYGTEIEARTGLTLKVEVSGKDRRLDSPLKTAMFRVAQEALTNAVKHAAASSVHVSLNFGADGVSVIVQDNGVGFDPAGLATIKRPAWGLAGMRERAALLNGTFRLETGPGEGTCVEVFLPYGEDDDEALNEADLAPNGTTEPDPD